MSSLYQFLAAEIPQNAYNFHEVFLRQQNPKIWSESMAEKDRSGWIFPLDISKNQELSRV